MSYGDPEEARTRRLRSGGHGPCAKTSRGRSSRRLSTSGINFFDTANVYSAGASEEVTGRALKASLARREDIVLATKLQGAMSPGPNGKGLSRKAVFQEIDASLRRAWGRTTSTSTRFTPLGLRDAHRGDPR